MLSSRKKRADGMWKVRPIEVEQELWERMDVHLLPKVAQFFFECVKEESDKDEESGSDDDTVYSVEFPANPPEVCSSTWS